MIIILNKRVVIFTALLCLFQVGYGQEKSDFNWLFSLRNYKDTTLSEVILATTQLSFNDTILNITVSDGLVQISDNNSSISDTNGELLFYTNGCQVIQADHQLMENGDSLNFGKFVTDFWNNCQSGYIGFQDIIILNDPKNEFGYYIIHKTQDYKINPFDIFIEGLKYTYVDISQNGGNGKVLKKNVYIYEKQDLIISFLSAIHHSNGKDWWFIQFTENNNQYIKFLINNEGVKIYSTQNIGPITTKGTSAGGFAKFSPDGKKWVWYTYENGLHFFDFDRSSGELSNHQEKLIEFGKRKVFTGLEFSPNSRFIYISVLDTLLQVDTWSQNLDYEVIATYDGYQDPFPTNFHGMNLAPDCKIYMNSTNGVGSMHVINFPNKKGKACDFKQHAIDLPYYIGIGTVNFPRLRVDEVDVCDSTELYTDVLDIEHKKSLLKIYPNPVYDIAKIESEERGSLYLYDMRGQQIKRQEIRQGDNFLDMQPCMSGMYYLKFVDDKGRQHNSKIIKANHNE